MRAHRDCAARLRLPLRQPRHQAAAAVAALTPVVRGGARAAHGALSHRAHARAHPPPLSTPARYPMGRRARALSPLAHLCLLRLSAYTPTNVSKRAHTCGRGRDTRTAERCTMAQEVSDGAQGSCAIGLTRGVRVCAPWARRWGHYRGTLLSGFSALLAHPDGG